MIVLRKLKATMLSRNNIVDTLAHTPQGLSLFPGSSQYERYQKARQRLLSDEDVQEQLKRYGVNPNELGSHSTRKGSSTYVTTGVLVRRVTMMMMIVTLIVN